jgi:predicted Zn-dependent protease
MKAAGLPLDRDAMRLIAEIGFIGAQSGQPAAARAIFESLSVLRPDSTLPHIGLAMADLAADRPQDAARTLRDKGLKQHPADPELMAFLGLALHSAGQSAEAQKILSAVVEQHSPSTAPYVRMAGKLLSIDKGNADPASLMPRWSEQARKAG